MSINIKKCFESRFSDGFIYELDYSQLEVIGAAEISGDPNMMDDIRNGIDSHSQSAAWLSSHTYEEVRDGYLAGDAYFTKLRKNAKAPRFQLQYGAGAKSIAASNGITLEAAKGFIERYYNRYNVLKEFQDSVAEYVEYNNFKVSHRTIHGHDTPIMGGVWRSITGRGYYFEQDRAPDFLIERGEYATFSPTKFKNYPMQGFATGDIVPEMLGRVLRKIIADRMMHSVKLINTIHDSVLFDVEHDEGTESYMINVIKPLMQDVNHYMKERFGITLTLDFNVDIERGRTWADMKSCI